MKPFELLIAYRVIEFIERLPRKDQVVIRRRFLEIKDSPRNYSDYSELDDFGHRLNVNIFSKFAIKYWIDDTDAQIKILDIRAADIGK